jgi:hypothetical protein
MIPARLNLGVWSSSRINKLGELLILEINYSGAMHFVQSWLPNLTYPLDPFVSVADKKNDAEHVRMDN